MKFKKSNMSAGTPFDPSDFDPILATDLGILYPEP
jgi:hypothetical protein